MEPFPGEPKSGPSAIADLASEFEFADRLYRFWLRRYRGELERSGLPSRVSEVAILLTTQACRLYRSSIEECRRGEELGASVLARSLYETLIALKFVLKRNVRIIIAPSAPGADTYVARPPSRNNRAIGKAFLTREHRACLYVLHAQLESERLRRKRRAAAGANRAGLLKPSRSDAAAHKERAAIEEFVGREWCYVLKHKPHTYSGLSFEAIARLVDSNRKLSQWYAASFHIQSGVAHTASGQSHAKIKSSEGLELALQSAADEIRGTIQIAAAMLLACIATAHNELEGAPAFGKALAGMVADYRRIFEAYG